MKNVSKQVSLLAVSVMMALGLAVVPVGAQHGVHAEGTDSGTGSTGAATASAGTETSDNTSGHGGSLRDQAKELLQTKRQNGKEHTEDQRQKACEQRQKSIDTRTTNWSAAAQRHLDVFNSIFTKVKAFHDSKQLNVSSYDTLVAAATAKQTAAQSAVDALKALNVQVDCTQADPASSVATIKTAVSDARTTLQAYRSALKDLVVALRGASTAQTNTDTTTGGNQ